MGILLGFAPWIVYWVLVGNVPFTTAVLVALAVAVLSFVIGRVRGAPGRTLEIGAVATFLILTVLTFTLSQSFMERWMQPLSNAGIFLDRAIEVPNNANVRFHSMITVCLGGNGGIVHVINNTGAQTGCNASPPPTSE